MKNEITGDKMELDETDRQILRRMQDDVPLVTRPFLAVAKELGMTEDEVLTRVQKMIDSGIVRRFSASLKHRKLGITANPLCAWKVQPSRVVDVGEKMASFDEVTHCYERPIVPGKWEYNVFTMIHGYDREECEKTAEKISKAVGISDYRLLYSTKEFKKIYKRYD